MSTAAPRAVPAWAGVLAPAALHLLACLAAFDPTPHTGGDNATYISLATALWQGRGYVDLWDPALPPHGQFPPGFPALLAAAFGVGLRPLVHFKLVVVACSVGAVAASAAALRRAAGPGPGLAAALVLALLPGAARQASWVLADAPAWACVALAWWACLRAKERPDAWGLAALTGLALGAAVLLRTASLAPALGAALWALRHRRWRLGAAVGALAGAPAAWWTLGAGADSAYGRAFWALNPYRPEAGEASVLQVVARAPTNLARYASDLLPSLLGPAVAGLALAAVLALLALAGTWRARREQPLEAWMLAPTVALLALWPPVWADARYLLPALPLALALAARSLAGWRARWTVVPAAAAVALGVPAHVEQAERAAQCRAGAVCVPPVWHQWLTLADQARRELPPGSVVLSRKPSLLFLIAGLQGRLYPMRPGRAALLEEAERAGARYVLADGFSDLGQRVLWPAITEVPGRFCALAEQPDVLLLRLEPAGAAAPPAGELRRCAD